MLLRCMQVSSILNTSLHKQIPSVFLYTWHSWFGTRIIPRDSCLSPWLSSQLVDWNENWKLLWGFSKWQRLRYTLRMICLKRMQQNATRAWILLLWGFILQQKYSFIGITNTLTVRSCNVCIKYVTWTDETTCKLIVVILSRTANKVEQKHILDYLIIKR